MAFIVQFEDLYKVDKIILVKDCGLKWKVIESGEIKIKIKRLDNGDIKEVKRRNLDYFLWQGKIKLI